MSNSNTANATTGMNKNAAPTSRRKSVTIRTTLIAILSVLVAGLLVLAAFNMFSAWDQMHGARAMRSNNQIGDLFLSSAGALAQERGITNTAFASAGKASPELLARITDLRRRGDAALDAALAQVAKSAPFKGKDALLASVSKNRSALENIRSEADQQLPLDLAARNQETMSQWVPSITAVILSSQNLRKAAETVPTSALARTQILLDLREAMWVVTEYAGRERAIIGGAVAKGVQLNPQQMTMLAEYRGRLEQAWISVDLYSNRDFASSSVIAATDTARQTFFTGYENTRRSVYAASAEARTYPLTGDQWISEATNAIDSLLALSNSIGESAGSITTQVEESGLLGFVISIIGLLLAVSIGAFAFWIVVMRIARPIQSLTGTMSRLADGNLDIVIPSIDRGDEIGQMARAVEVFREAGLNNRRLEEAAEEGRELTERERQQREAQKAAEALQLKTATDTLGMALGHLAEGDVGHRIEVPFVESLDQIRQDFNQSAERLEQALRKVGDNAAAINSGSEQIRVAADDLAKRTEMQAASVEETAAAIEQITIAVRDTSARAGEAGELVACTREQAEHSGKVVEQAVAAMAAIEHSSNEIGSIIGVIDSIAFQTNLLALNAGVEAARAGDAGKGFAVVAQEVRELAQRSATAAKDIKSLIASSSQQVTSGVNLVDETGKALKQIVVEVQEINQHVVAIVEAAKEQSVGLGEVNTSVNLMDQSAQENAAMVEQTSAASHSLASEAAALNGLLAKFKFGDTREQSPRQTSTPPSPARALIKKVANAVGRNSGAATAATEAWEEF